MNGRDSIPGLVRRVAVPALLAACVAVELRSGGESLPAWLANLAIKAGPGPDRALRIVLALELTGLVVALASRAGSRAVAWAAGGAFAFSGLAELSAIVAAPGTAPVAASTWIAPLLGLGVGTAILAVLLRPDPATDHRERLTPWKAIGLLALATAATAFAGRVTLAPRTGFRGADGVETVVLNPEQWVGMTFAQAGFARRLPQLTPLTMEGTKWVVLYVPTCSRCHEVFKAYFAGPQHGNVIAVSVPPVPGEPVLREEGLGDIECAECERLSLPPGPRWVVHSPTIVKVEDGRVTCVTSSDYDRCRPVSAP